MGKNPTPKWGAKSIVDSDLDNELVRSAVDHIQKNIPFHLDVSGLEELSSACRDYKGNLELLAGRVYPSNIKTTLAAFLFKGKRDGPLPALINMLEQLDDTTKSHLKVDTQLSERIDPALAFPIDLGTLLDDLKDLYSAIEEFYKRISSLSSGTKRQTKEPEHTFIRNLFDIFQRSTGKASKRSYNSKTAEIGGEFHRFAWVCIKPFESFTHQLGLKPPTNTSIFSSIQKAYE